MALTPFSTDMDIISKLADNPNNDNNLTAAQLKAKFDEGGKAIKTYINDTLLDEVGDMQKSTYDTDDDGSVDSADLADEATALATARTITVGNKSNTFDGSADATFPLADVIGTGNITAAMLGTIIPTDVGVTISDTDLTAGSSELTTGTLYCYYE